MSSEVWSWNVSKGAYKTGCIARETGGWFRGVWRELSATKAAVDAYGGGGLLGAAEGGTVEIRCCSGGPFITLHKVKEFE